MISVEKKIEVPQNITEKELEEWINENVDPDSMGFSGVEGGILDDTE